MLKILDNNYQTVGILNYEGSSDKITPYFEDKHYQNLNTGAETFEFSTVGNSKQAEHLIVGNHVVFSDHEGVTKLFSIVNVEDVHDNDYIKNVYCEVCGLELINEILRPITVIGKDCRLFLQSVLQDTDWQVGYVDGRLWQPRDFEITDYKSVYSVLQEYIISEYGGEISFRVEFRRNKLQGKYIDVYKDKNIDVQHRFSYDRNLTTVTRKVDSSNLVTALIGVGTNNTTFKSVHAEDKPKDQDFIASESALRKWGKDGKHLMGVFKAETDDPATLLELTREELLKNTEPQITYELNAELLDGIPKIGATVGVADHDLELYVNARIMELTTSKTDPNSNTCVFANFKEVTKKNTDFSYNGILSYIKEYLKQLETGILDQTVIENIKKYLKELNMSKEEIDKIFEDLKNDGNDNIGGDSSSGGNTGGGSSSGGTGVVLGKFVVFGNSTNLRDAVGLETNIIGKADVGERYPLVERGYRAEGSRYEWVKIEYEGGYAYCALQDESYISDEQVVENKQTIENGLWIGDSITVMMKDTYRLVDSSIGVCAVVGKSADYYLKNYNLITSAKKNPAYISLLLGVNNPSVTKTMTDLLDKLRASYPSTYIYVNAVLPVAETHKTPYFASSKAYNNAITNYNTKMKEYCNKYKYLKYISTSRNGLTSNGYLKSTMCAKDGIHLNKAGSQILYKNITTGIASTFTSSGGTRAYWEDGKMSATCFRFIKGMEGFGKYAYQDSAGYWTIAYGVTAIGEKDVYDKLKAQTPLDETIGAKESWEVMNKNYGKKILTAFKKLGCNNQNQFDALCSLAYNGGVGSITGDNTLTRAIKKNPNDETAIRTAWEKFKITAGGEVLKGLKIRRKNECNMYFGKSVEMRPITTINANGSYGKTITANNGNGWLPEDTGGSNSTVEKGEFDTLATLQGDKLVFTMKDGVAYNCKTLKSLKFATPTSGVTTSYASKLVFRTPKNCSPMIFQQSTQVWFTGDDCVNGAILPIADSKYEIIIKYNSNKTIPRKFRGSVNRVHYGGSYTKHEAFTGAEKVRSCARSFYDNREKFKYSTTTPISWFGSKTPAQSKEKWYTGGLYHIDCSTFINQIFKGRGYTNSIYANTKSYGVGVNTKFAQATDLGRFAAEQANTCVYNGWHLPEVKTEDDWHLLKRGDLVFWSSRSSEGSRNEVVAERFMQVGHVGFISTVEQNEQTGKTDVFVYDVSTPTGVVLFRELRKNHPSKILFFARIRK